MPSLPNCDCPVCAEYSRRYPTEPTFDPFVYMPAPTPRPVRPMVDEPPVTFDDLEGPEDEDLSEDQTACAYCGDLVDESDLITPSDPTFRDRYGRTLSADNRGCSECLHECEDCNDHFRYLSDHRDRYCDGCNTYVCGEAYMRYCDECDYARCENCGDCDCYQGQAIRDYSWRPAAFNMKGDRSHVMMGIELEVTGSQQTIVECVQNHDDSEDHLYMKHDGSVDGVEIVTHPGTLEWNRNEFDWAGLLEEMADGGCSIYNEENGLHIHVSRESFSQGNGRTGARHQMTWLMFLYRNAEDLQLLARRDGGRWAAFNAPEQGELKRKAMARRGDRSDRYVAVNCQNRDTYEMRFFASTLNPVEFFAAIEFADASVEYTRQLRAADVLRGNGMSWSAFIDWADAQGDRYSALCAEGRRRVPTRTDATNKPWYPVSRNRRTPARSSW